MMGVREYPKNREEDNEQDGGLDTNWIGRCLEDRYEIGAIIAHTELVAIHEASLVDDGTSVLATVYKGLQLDDAGLEVLHGDLGALRKVGYQPACGMVQTPEGFVIFEHAPSGSPLPAYLKTGKAISTSDALIVGGQILAALDALHDIGQVSHSLAPHSIWLDDSGERLVCAVTRLGQQSLLGLANAKTRAEGACYAFPSYLMPEAVSGRELTSASDIYCAGLILYELLAGRAAFSGDDFKKVARKHALERPLNPRIVNRQAKLSSELDRAIMKALEKTVKRRHESAMVFFEALKSSAEGVEVWSAPAGSSVVASGEDKAAANEVLETLAMGSLASDESDGALSVPSGVETTEDAFPETSPPDEDVQAQNKRNQTQPLSSTLSSAVLAGFKEKKAKEGEAEANSESHVEAVSEPASGDAPSQDDGDFAENADWYADSLEQYESKTAHYDPYELEGEDRDLNLFPKILGGVVVLALILFFTLSGSSDIEEDSKDSSKNVVAKTDSNSTKSNDVTDTPPASKLADTLDAQPVAADKAAADTAAADTAAADKAAADTAAADTAAADKAAADKAAADKAAADTAAADKAAADKAAKAAKAVKKQKPKKKPASKPKKTTKPKTTLTDKQALAVVEAKERKKREAADRKRALKKEREAKASAALTAGGKLLGQGQFAGAKVKFSEALKAKGLGPRGTATARAGLGAIEYESANFSGSVKQYKLSLVKYKRNADRWYLLARSYYRLGNKADARKSLEKALAIKANHSKAKKLLKRVTP
jgi:serine/threonine protein kinase